MLRKIGLALALCGAVVMLGGAGGGCQSGGAIGKVTSNEQGLADATVIDERAMIVAESAVFGANAAASAAVDAGLLVPGSPKAVQIADYLSTAKSTLDVARAAYRAGDADRFSARITETQKTIQAAWKLIPEVQALTTPTHAERPSPPG